MIKFYRESLTKRLTLFACITAFTLAALILCFRYYTYSYALAWHAVHGSYGQIERHKVKMPMLWWQEDSGRYETSLLVRASSSYRPEIVVSPELAGAMSNTDEDELKSMQALISARNRTSHAQTSTLVLLPSTHLKLYCKKEDGIVVSNLYCHAAGFPYSFVYSGPSSYEKEAEVLLLGLD